MPCNSDYLEATPQERSLSAIYALIDEIENGVELNMSHFRGYHPLAYNRFPSKEQLDAGVARLCKLCKANDVSEKSLELQMWWREHLAADKARIEREKASSKREKIKREAVAKLTPEEREALGV